MVLKKAKKKVLLFPKGQFNVRIVYSTRVIKVFHATTIMLVLTFYCLIPVTRYTTLRTNYD